jgi:hypothetical protein
VPITELIDTNRLTPSLQRTYSLDQVPDALRQIEAGRVRGKLAVSI